MLLSRLLERYDSALQLVHTHHSSPMMYPFLYTWAWTKLLYNALPVAMIQLLARAGCVAGT